MLVSQKSYMSSIINSKIAIKKEALQQRPDPKLERYKGEGEMV